MPQSILIVIGAYLLGSVPFALVVGKGIYHVDVREHGSGNIGTTNVFRVLGKGPGIAVFIGDLLKGFIPVFLTYEIGGIGNYDLIAVLAAGAAIAGHTFPLYLRFKGGKGVATGAGAILALMPALFLISFVVFWLVLIVSRAVSVASLTAVTALCFEVVATKQPVPYVVFTFLGTAVIFYAHRSNIKRLRQGEENRVTFPWNRK